ncbi:MAG: hypothetical protein WB783_08655 [Arenicellales bacterium]
MAEADPDLIYVWCAAILLTMTALAGVSYRALPQFSVRFFRAAAIFLAIYVTVEPFYIPAANGGEYAQALHFHDAGRWIGLGLAIVGVFRPAAVFGSAVVLWMVRDLQTELTGFYFSTLDIRNVAEVTSFVSLVVMLMVTFLARARPDGTTDMENE